MKGSEGTETHTVWLLVSRYLRNFVLEYFKDPNIFGYYSRLIYKMAVCMYTITEVLLCIFKKRFTYNVCVCVCDCACVCVFVLYEFTACFIQQRASDPLELEVRVVLRGSQCS